jgi:hypothetical protein
MEELLEELAAGGLTSCLVSPGSSTTSLDVRRIVAAADQGWTPVGFLAGWAGDAAATAHARKMSTYRWQALERAVVWHSAGVQGFPYGQAGPLSVIEPTVSALAERLAEPHRLAALMTHGNGVDAFLGFDYVCALAGAGSIDGERFLPCGGGSPCLRSQLLEDGTRTTPSRLPASGIAADVVFLGCCGGLLGAEALVSPARSMAQQLAASEWAGAVITTVRHGSMPRFSSLLVWHHLHAGRMLGAICLELNRMTAAAFPPGEQAWVLIGDPAAAPGCGTPPAYRAPAVPLGRDQPVSLCMEPGAVYVLALQPEASADLVVVEPESNELEPDRSVFCQRDETGGLVLLAQMGERPLRCGVAARRPEAWTDLRRIAGLEQMKGNLRFAQRFLDVLAVGPVQPPGRRSPALLQLQQNLLELDDSAPQEPPARRYSGVEATVRRAGEASATRWSYLSHRLLEELVRHLRSSVESGVTRTWWMPGPSPLSNAESRCCYCGMAVQVVCSRMVGVDRRVATCDHCALVADTSADVGRLTLAGPASVSAGQDCEYVLSGRWTQGRDWHHLVGALVPEPLPWQPAMTGERTSFSGEGSDFQLGLSLHLSWNAYPGVYFVRAAVVADGHLWVLRRPLTVESSTRSSHDSQ